MKLKSTFSKFIHSKLLLYIVFTLSVIIFLGNLLTGHFDVVVYFVLISGLTSFFTNNMTIVLLIPLVSVILYIKFIKHKMDKNKEGMENSNNPSNTNKSEQDKIDELKKTHSNSVPTNNSSLPVVPINEEQQDNEETFKNNDSKKSDSNKKKKYNIDYASTVEEAYDNLNNIIGSDGIQNLTGDTKRLMDQQLKLTEAMKNIQPLVETMGPLLEKAGGLLNSMGGSESIGNLANFAKNFSSSSNK
jgi:hypothetical protein